MADDYEGIYDESDWESDFEGLEYDEARRRRRRGRGGRRSRPGVRTSGSAWAARRPTGGGSTAATLRREAEAGRARDRQLASAVNTTREDVGDVEGQLRKVNGDLSRLRQISLISLLLPPTFARERLFINNRASEAPILDKKRIEGSPGSGEVDVVTGSQLNILPVVLFMTMARGIGMPGRAGSSASGAGGDMMMPLLLILLLQQQGSTGTTTGGTGGLDSTALLLVLLASGGLS